MKAKARIPLARQIPSRGSMVFLSSLAAFLVLGAALWLQWLIYNGWLHRTGPLRLVGSALAGALTFTFIWRWQSTVRERKLEMLQRFQTIARMNDRIRNALQAIECATYATNPQAALPVQKAVDVIERTLQEVLSGTGVARREVQGGGKGSS
jgi:thiol:disulfide interchange protein